MTERKIEKLTLNDLYKRHYKISCYALHTKSERPYVECESLHDFTGISIDHVSRGVYVAKDSHDQTFELTTPEQYYELVNKVINEKGKIFWTKREATEYVDKTYSQDEWLLEKLHKDLKFCRKDAWDESVKL